MLNTTWRGKKYVFAMNGQTGKFVGDLPMDKKLAAGWFGYRPHRGIMIFSVRYLGVRADVRQIRVRKHLAYGRRQGSYS